VGAIAIGLEARCVEQPAKAALLATGVEVGLVHAVAAGGHAQLDARRPCRITCEQLDHATRVVAIQGGIRAAQHLETLGHVEVEGRSLA
jgi:hypothetical protein